MANMYPETPETPQTPPTEPTSYDPVGYTPPASVPPASAAYTPPPTYTTPPAAVPVPLTPSEERTWAMLAHLSVLVNLFTGFLGPVVALIIYMIYRDRSRFVAYHAMQSMVQQLFWWIGGGILATIFWVLGGALSFILIGCLFFPLAMIFTVAPIISLILGIIAAVKVNNGENYKYWLTGDWVKYPA